MKGKIGVSPIDDEEGCFTCGEVWRYAIAGEYLVTILVPVVLVILTQFLECRF